MVYLAARRRLGTGAVQPAVKPAADTLRRLRQTGLRDTPVAHNGACAAGEADIRAPGATSQLDNPVVVLVLCCALQAGLCR